MASLKEQAVSGIKWNAISSIANLAVTFLTGLVLARLLTPSDFGTVGMVGVFFAIASTFIDSGFALGLIRKPDLTNKDCSTAFFFNIIVACISYVILYIAASYIADFFNSPILKSIVRISAIALIIGSFSTVQHALLNKAVNFKSIGVISLISYIVSGGIGIFLAFSGFGVWSLVVKNIAGSLISGICVWYVSKWRPCLCFSYSSFRYLFGFGSKLLASKLLDKLFSNLHSLAIGKFYSPADLGYYTKASDLAGLPGTFLYNIVGNVSMPVLSQIQNDDELLIHSYRRFIKMCSMVIFFIMILVAAIGKPIIIFLYTDKWATSIPYLQIFCFTLMFYHIHAININLLLAKGRSDLMLRLEVIKKIISLSALLIALPFGIMALCLSTLITTQLSLIVNTYYAGKLFNLGYIKQWGDFLPYIVYSIIACTPAFLLSYVKMSNLLNIIICSSISFIMYLLILHYRKDSSLSELVKLAPVPTSIKNRFNYDIN